MIVETPESAAEPDASAHEWAIVEIMGHRKHMGRIREEERFGEKFLRVDVPKKGDPATHGWTTHYYSGGSIFGITPTDEATVMRLNAPYERAHLYQLASPTEPDQSDETDPGDETEDFA